MTCALALWYIYSPYHANGKIYDALKTVRARYGTGDSLNLQKRDCPIKMELEPYGCDDIHVRWEIGGDEHNFYSESIIGGEFAELMHAVYNLYHEKNDRHKFPRYSRKRVISAGEDRRLQRGEFQLETCVWWDQREYSSVTFSRKDNWHTEGFYAESPDPVQISIRRHSERSPKRYCVDGKDLAYAIGKGATEAIKKYGFYGYFFSTGSDDECGDFFRIHELLFFKAYALDAMEVREYRTVWKDEDGWRHAEGTSFEKEMELLLFDM